MQHPDLLSLVPDSQAPTSFPGSANRNTPPDRGVITCMRGPFLSAELVVVPVSLLLVGLYLLAQGWLTRARRRRAADAWIAHGYESRAASYAWRIDELTSAAYRRCLARAVGRVLVELGDRPLAPLSPLNRKVLLPHRELIGRLAARLSDVDRPVAAAGVLAVDRLLSSPGSALYDEGHDVRAELAETLTRLEPRRPQAA
jgi:hypothetical protein